MPTWLIVVLGIAAVVGIVALVLQLPAQNRLVDVAGAAKPDKLIKKLDAGQNPDAVGWFGLTPITGAIQSNRVENVKILLARGADPNRPPGKMNHLQQCVVDERWDIMKILLEAGADPDRPGFLKQTAFEQAVDEAKTQAVRLMLEHGADPHTIGIDGESVLAATILNAAGEKKPEKQQRHLEVARLLLEAGASPNTRIKDGDFPLVVAAIAYPPLLHLLVESGAITDVSHQGEDLKPIIDNVLAENPIAPTHHPAPPSA